MIKRIELYRELSTIIKSTKIIILCFFQLLLALVTILPPFIYSYLINDVMIPKQMENYIFVIIGYILIFILQTIIIVLNKKVSNTVFLKLKIKIKKTVLENYTKMPIKTYSSYNTGDLNMRLDSDIDSIVNFYTIHIIGVGKSFIIIALIGIILFRLNWLLALISCISIPITYYVSKWIGKRANKVSVEYRDKYGKFEFFIYSSLQNWKDIKSNNLENEQDMIMVSKWKELSKLFIKNQIYSYCNMTFIAIKDLFISNIILYFIGGILVINGHLLVGILLSFINFYAEFYNQISDMMNSVFSYNKDVVNIGKVKEILSLCFEKSLPKTFIDGSICFENVTFGYVGEKYILKNLNLKIDSGIHYSLMGDSGCGKSTLFKIILGEYQPHEGKVLVGGNDISIIPKEYLHKNVGIVMQEPVFFNLTIKENLLMVNSHLRDEEIAKACKMVNIEDFIERLPYKYDTVIGEKGVRLSGGQKQRLAIARAILGHYHIILMDESTSALDGDNEKKIMNMVATCMINKTVIVVSHRLSTIKSVEKTIMMKDGKILCIENN